MGMMTRGVADSRPQPTTTVSPPAMTTDSVIAAVRDYVSQNDLASAIDLLRPYAQSPLAHPTLFSDFLVILTWSGQTNEAIERFESLPDTFPERAYLLRNMAKAYYDERAFAKAETLYHRALSMVPDDDAAFNGLVAALMGQGRTDEALRTLENGGDGKDSLSRGLLKARLLIDHQEDARALNWYDRLILKFPESMLAIARERDDRMAGLAIDRQETVLAQYKARLKDRLPSDIENYILCLVLFRRYTVALTAMDDWDLLPAATPAHKAYWYAWAYYKSNRITEAEAQFRYIIDNEPAYFPAQIGLAYCLVARSYFTEAESRLDALSREHADHFEILFAQAHLYEKQSRFWEAIKTYDRIIARYPDNIAAKRLRTRAYSDMGATSVAARMAAETLPQDSALQQSLTQDKAHDRMQWGESDRAVDLLNELRDSDPDQRLQYDYIAALADSGRNEKVLAEYDLLEKRGAETPAWLKAIAAGAFNDAGLHGRALHLFDEALAIEPNSRQLRIGRFQTLEQLRRWSEAEKMLTALEKETPPEILINNQRQGNPQWLELAMLRGWFLTIQNRLREADAHFSALHQRFPANIEIRNALAHIHYWRGWPRQALSEFQVIDTRRPDYLPAQPGKLTIINALDQKQAARQQLAERHLQWPDNAHLLEVQKAFDIEQMNTLRSHLEAQREDNDTLDLTFGQTYSTPVSLNARFYAYWLRKQTLLKDPEKGNDLLHRNGAGLQYHINSVFSVDGAVSIDPDISDPGIAGRLDVTPTDHWQFGFFADSYSTDVPARARRHGIEAASAGAEAVWRQSEWRQINSGYTFSRFSDANSRDQLYFRYGQHLWIKYDWLMRAKLEAYTSSNSKGDQTTYFNPTRDYSLSATHITEHTVRKSKGLSFMHRLYLTLGQYYQEGYAGDWIGSIRYEQEYEFGYRHYLLGGISLGRKVYDGEGVMDITADLVYQWRF